MASKEAGSVKQAGRQWLGVVADCWQLGAEASLVVPLRLARLACGGARADAEAQLMVSEKVAAHSALMRDACSGSLGSSAPEMASRITRHYLRHVRANRKRLVREMIG